MLNLPYEILVESNKLSSDSAWLATFEVEIDAGQTLRVVNNNEDVTIDGYVYTKFPFQIEPYESKSSGELSALTISLSNVNRVVQQYLEPYAGLVDKKAYVKIFNSNYLTVSKVALSWEFIITDTQCDEEVVTFTLGASNPFLQLFPHYRYLYAHCKWKYRGLECGYSGADPGGEFADPCPRTFEACEARSNGPRFGGYPGLKPGGTRIV